MGEAKCLAGWLRHRTRRPIFTPGSAKPGRRDESTPATDPRRAQRPARRECVSQGNRRRHSSASDCLLAPHGTTVQSKMRRSSPNRRRGRLPHQIGAKISGAAPRYRCRGRAAAFRWLVPPCCLTASIRPFAIAVADDPGGDVIWKAAGRNSWRRRSTYIAQAGAETVLPPPMRNSGRP